MTYQRPALGIDGEARRCAASCVEIPNRCFPSKAAQPIRLLHSSDRPLSSNVVVELSHGRHDRLLETPLSRFLDCLGDGSEASSECRQDGPNFVVVMNIARK